VADIIHQLMIHATPETTYQTLTTQEGLAQWWTRDTSTESKIGSIAEFAFNQRAVVFRMRIEQLQPSQWVAWHLRLLVDDTYPPATRVLECYDLHAEFWIEGAGNEYGTDTNQTGTYNYVATVQVHFYAPGRWGRGATNEPMPLDQIPPLVFSEIMRDVDLFVGVASVGNDPTWADGRSEGRYLDYWQQYSFGDLSESAKTRKQILEGLIPRLKIASRCELTERYLIVRGDLRTYKIHLGSGNILMGPNDQYLCIVPKAGTAVGPNGKLFLPFEGDHLLAVILSKAFLLAADRKISDPTITRQLLL
jgi:hypothetical protein